MLASYFGVLYQKETTPTDTNELINKSSNSSAGRNPGLKTLLLHHTRPWQFSDENVSTIETEYCGYTICLIKFDLVANSKALIICNIFHHAFFFLST